MQQDELKAIGGKFRQGIEKLRLLETCLTSLASGMRLDLHSKGVDEERGELTFLFSGMRFYVRVRITDRDVDDVGTEYRVPVGWLDWGRFDANDARENPIQSNFFDERGILCEIGKQELYCNFENCDDEQVRRAMLQKFNALVDRAIAANNTL